MPKTWKQKVVFSWKEKPNVEIEECYFIFLNGACMWVGWKVALCVTSAYAHIGVGLQSTVARGGGSPTWLIP